MPFILLIYSSYIHLQITIILTLFAVSLVKLWWFQNCCEVLLLLLLLSQTLLAKVSLMVPSWLAFGFPPFGSQMLISSFVASHSIVPENGCQGFFDGSYLASTNSDAGGGIIFYSNGSRLAAFAFSISHVTSALVVEALACRTCIFLAGHLGIKVISIFGDNKSLINKVQASSIDDSSIVAITNDIRAVCSFFFFWSPSLIPTNLVTDMPIILLN